MGLILRGCTHGMHASEILPGPLTLGCHMECHTMEVGMRSQHQDYIRGIDVLLLIHNTLISVYYVSHSNSNQFCMWLIWYHFIVCTLTTIEWYTKGKECINSTSMYNDTELINNNSYVRKCIFKETEETKNSLLTDCESVQHRLVGPWLPVS